MRDVFVFTGGEAVSPSLGRRLVAEHSSAGKIGAVAADSGLCGFEAFQSEFGAFELLRLVGDWDSLSDSDALLRYPREIVRTLPIDKDWTDTELALDEARSFAGGGRVVLVGAGGGERIDHLLAVFDLFATPLRPDVWLAGHQTLRFLGPGDSAAVRGLPPSDVLSVLRTSASRTGGSVRSRGLVWESPLFRADGVPSLSNRVRADSEQAEISVVSGEFVLVHPSPADVSVSRVRAGVSAGTPR